MILGRVTWIFANHQRILGAKPDMKNQGDRIGAKIESHSPIPPQVLVLLVLESNWENVPPDTAPPLSPLPRSSHLWGQPLSVSWIIFLSVKQD